MYRTLTLAMDAPPRGRARSALRRSEGLDTRGRERSLHVWRTLHPLGDGLVDQNRVLVLRGVDLDDAEVRVERLVVEVQLPANLLLGGLRGIELQCEHDLRHATESTPWLVALRGLSAARRSRGRPSRSRSRNPLLRDR